MPQVPAFEFSPEEPSDFLDRSALEGRGRWAQGYEMLLATRCLWPGPYGMSTAQLELRWETQNGVVPVTATCSPEHAVPRQLDLANPKVARSQNQRCREAHETALASQYRLVIHSFSLLLLELL